MTSLSQTYKNLINLPCLKRSIAIVFLAEDKNDLYVVTLNLKLASKICHCGFALHHSLRVLTAASSLIVTRTETGSTTPTCMTLFFEVNGSSPFSFEIERLQFTVGIESKMIHVQKLDTSFKMCHHT